MPTLPPKSAAAEDHFVAEMREAATEDLIEAVREAVRGGRPQLAGRLVGLLGEQAPDDPELQRAQRAASFLCLTPDDPVMLQVLDEALAHLQAQRVQRFKARVREGVSQQARYFGGETLPTRRRRR